MRGQILTLHEKLKNKEISAESLTKSYLDKINQKDKDLNAFITVCDEQAIISAKEIDKKISENAEISALCGIPMTIKDNLSTKGVKTTCASKILENYYPIYTATAVQKLFDDDAVMLGKCNMDEFGMGSTCENSYFGATKNPIDLTRVPGGSSGGLSSAVASGMAVYGLGSDTGGSIRQPASFCGNIGLKPTYGAVSRYGLIAYGSSLDTVGIIARSVEDVAIVFDEISFYDKKDATCSNQTRVKTFDYLQNDVKGLKIGVIDSLFEGLNPEIEKALKNALNKFKEMGAELINIKLDKIGNAISTYYILACAEASSNLARYDSIRYGYQAKNYTDMDDLICKTRTEGFGKEVQRRIMLGNYVLSSGYYDAYYKKALTLQNDISQSFAKAFEKVDVIFSPTVATTAFKIGSVSTNPVEMYLTDLYTVPVNICGLPSVNVPCGFDSENMPIGMQLIGDKFNEHKILNLAYRYEDLMQDLIYKK